MEFEINHDFRVLKLQNKGPHCRVTRRFLKNEPTVRKATDLKFRTVGRVEVPDTVIQKNSEKFSAYAKRRFLISQMSIPEFQQEYHQKTQNSILNSIK